MTDELNPALMAEAEAAIRAYGEARVNFPRVQDRLSASRLLFGNDNKVGIAGEFWALRLYLSRGFALHPVPIHGNNPSYDFIAMHPVTGVKHVQVKAISAENKLGLTSFVKVGRHWDELCIVQMNEHLSPERFGIADKKAFADRCKVRSGQMRADKRWLDEGWMEVITANLTKPTN